MDLRERTSAHFLRSAAAHEVAAVTLSPAVAAAGESLARCLLSGHKILCAGAGCAATSALYMTSLLMNRFQRERPGLPAMALACEPGALNVGTADSDLDDTLARQLRTLGQADDCLILFTWSQSMDSMTATIEAAKDREIAVIVLDNTADGLNTGLLNAADICIPAASPSPVLCHELHVSVIHCLCDLIDLQIFGEEL